MTACAVSMAAIAPLSAYSADEGSVAWLRDGKVETRPLPAKDFPETKEAKDIRDSNVSDKKVPLGSLWKLFTYAYLTDSHAQETAFTCSAKNTQTKAEQSEERYCCEPGEKVERDAALARSCAPYFSPARLGLTEKPWVAYWQSRSKIKWLQHYQNLQPDTQVSVRELLEALASFSPNARAAARTALLETSLEGYGREAWAQLGTGIRYKTYSWHLADKTAFGGAAGWLADGTPFWFGTRGSSRSALSNWAPILASTLPLPRWANIGSIENTGDDVSCVDVDFFARYPLREVSILSANAIAPAKAGTLSGKYRLQFGNGNALDIVSNGNLNLSRPAGAVPQISGRFSINDYVARVVDREGDATIVEAARSLAIVVRSYLVQNANFERGCWHIADATSRQRVSPNPPTEAALGVAWFSNDLILQGVNVRYHNDIAATNRMSLKDAISKASQGWNFERILASSFPQATISSMNGKSDCAPLGSAQAWLSNAAGKWQAILGREPGFENPETMPAVCELNHGNPYSDQKRMRIYVRGWRSLDERITLAHEYLHLALRFHPNGANEVYVEKLARRLIEGTT
ncbi:DUF2300 domain-containing protein [Undibacterium sp. TJN19]|uniref:DUF2300 domain-containing protein n=1 Tax=Undibacterium sp. TJN19 TaxID=3413055 RepID=UPI003BF321E8